MKIALGKKSMTKILIITGLIVSIASYFINDYIDSAFKNQIYHSLDKVPHNRVALLLGTAKTFNGRGNLYFITRINAVTALYRSKKIDKIIASGDNSEKAYDEPTDMRQALIDRGVDPKDIYLDYAGFRTLDSIVRLKKVFNVDKVTIVSQKTHCQRALFLAEQNDIDAVAFIAQDVIHPGKIKLQIREYLARVKAWMDVFILNKSPRFLGKKIDIS